MSIGVFRPVSTGVWGYWYLPTGGVHKRVSVYYRAECDCGARWESGIGGEPAETKDEAKVAAIANGWYVSDDMTESVCPECQVSGPKRRPQRRDYR